MGAETLWDIWQGAFPDNQGVITGVFVSADRACAEVTFVGTHTGPLHIADGQIPATGRSVYVPVAQVHTMRDDKFATSHLYFDQLGLVLELGLMPVHLGGAAR